MAVWAQLQYLVVLISLIVRESRECTFREIFQYCKDKTEIDWFNLGIIIYLNLDILVSCEFWLKWNFDTRLIYNRKYGKLTTGEDWWNLRRVGGWN